MVQKKTKQVAVDEFLRIINVKPEDVSINLKKYLYIYIQERYASIHCCVLSNKDIEKRDSVYRILKSYNITPKYESIFSVIIRQCSVSTSIGTCDVPKKIFQESEDHTELYKMDFADFAV